MLDHLTLLPRPRLAGGSVSNHLPHRSAPAPVQGSARNLPDGPTVGSVSTYPLERRRSTITSDVALLVSYVSGTLPVTNLSNAPHLAQQSFYLCLLLSYFP